MKKGLGQANASRINQSFMLWGWITPILGAVVADQYLGRLDTIIYSAVAYMLGLVLLALSALFVVSAYPVAVGGLALAMFLIGIGTGGIKANVGSLLAEQYTGTEEIVTTTEDGEKIVIDPKLTIQRQASPFFFLSFFLFFLFFLFYLFYLFYLFFLFLLFFLYFLFFLFFLSFPFIFYSLFWNTIRNREPQNELTRPPESS